MGTGTGSLRVPDRRGRGTGHQLNSKPAIFLRAGSNFSGVPMSRYRLAQDLRPPLHRVAMPRAPRLVAPGGTVHVVSRCNNGEFCFRTPSDFEVLVAHLGEMHRTYQVVLYGYTLMSNHVHLLLQAPPTDALARPLRWFLTQTAKAFHKLRGRHGHFWERRYRACLIEDDPYALTALRYLDRNAVRARLVEDPAAYPWSSCAAYACGTPNPLITLHPTYLALSPYPAVRQRQYRTLLAPSADPAADARDPRWTKQSAVGSDAFVAAYRSRRRARPKVAKAPS
jgi:putative transposase